MKLNIQITLLVMGLTVGQNSFAVSDLKNCRDDVAKFCGDVKKGGGRISRCLSEHTSELSEQCRKSAGLGGGADSVASPQSEIPVIPTDVKAKIKGRGGEGGVVSPKGYAEIKNACIGELRSYCWDAKEGDARGATDCLGKHKENLGEDCTQFLYGENH